MAAAAKGDMESERDLIEEMRKLEQRFEQMYGGWKGPVFDINTIATRDTPATREWRLHHNRAIEQAAAARHRHRRRLEQAAAAAMSALATANDAIADAGIATPTADDADGAADDDEEMDNAVAGDDEEPLVYQGPRP